MLGVELLGNRGLPVHSDVTIEREGRGKQLKMKQKFVIEKENDLWGRTDLKETRGKYQRAREKKKGDGFSYPFYICDFDTSSLISLSLSIFV